MPTVLITGANRGIGLEFTRQYLADGWDVIATAREVSPELEAGQRRVVGDVLGRLDEPVEVDPVDAIDDLHDVVLR